MAYAGWTEGDPLLGCKTQPRNEKLGELLRDGKCSDRMILPLHLARASGSMLTIAGLHFTPKGYELMYQEVIKTIHDHYPEMKADVLPFIFPTWEVAPKYEEI